MRSIKCIQILMIILALPVTVMAGELSVSDILNKVDRVEKYDHVIMQTEQTIITSDGDERLLKITSWAVNTGDKQLSVYTYPGRVKGVKILMLNDGDDIWSYSPRTRRVRHLASHAKKNKVMGSDFTYEDMGGGKMSEKYTGVFIRDEVQEGVSCYVLDLKPTPKGPSYSRVVAWVGKRDFVVRKINFFQDNEQKAFKTLFLRGIREQSGHLVPMEMVMVNHEDGGKTKNVVSSVDFETSIANRVFDSGKLNR